jgi:heat shock protein HslJ
MATLPAHRIGAGDEGGNRATRRVRLTGMKNLIVFVTLTLVLAACGEGEVTLDTSSWPRPDGDWQLVAGLTLVDNYPITMSIDDTNVSGRAACNSYFGTVTVNGSAVSFAELGQTAMGCEPAVMAAEATFLTMLGLAESFEYAEGGLVLETPQGDLVFHEVAPAPTAALIDTTWMLETLLEGETASSVGGDPATLLLGADGTLSASTGCRTLTGSWLENGGVIIVPELSAEGECPDELWKQDSLVVTVVGDEFSAEIEGDRLTLTSMGGDGLVYRAEV